MYPSIEVVNVKVVLAKDNKRSTEIPIPTGKSQNDHPKKCPDISLLREFIADSEGQGKSDKRTHLTRLLPQSCNSPPARTAARRGDESDRSPPFLQESCHSRPGHTRGAFTAQRGSSPRVAKEGLATLCTLK
ncbi:hypothetical protein E2C01_035844 [Portunus trituberculatus]|uniref:Uncharacterized protein n=1 Tax=Portunus trituberculatus TaxID=210409 RepID=A0A5B7FAE7_PORTR|nr:hypothetical protein [Portunus trituberculatus]